MGQLIVMDQVTYFSPIFEPEYETGSHGEVNPLTGAMYGAYGLTIVDYEKRSAELIRLSDRTHPKGSAYANKQKFAPVPAPDFVEDFPPEDTRGVVAIFLYPESLTLQAGDAYDLTFEVLLGNKTPTDLTVTLEVLDLTPDNGEATSTLSRSNLLLASGTEAVVLLAVSLSDAVVGPKTIQVTGEAGFDIMVQPGECVLDLQPYIGPAVFYQVDGPDTYALNIGSPVILQFTTSNGTGDPEVWEFSDSVFLQTHNLNFDDTGVLSSMRVTGPAGVYQVAVFVEQTTNFGEKIYSSKIMEIALV